MAILFAIPGFDATDDASLWDQATACSQDTGRSLSGSRGSIKIASGAGNTAGFFDRLITPGNTGRQQATCYFDNLPTSNCYLFAPERTASPFSAAVAMDTSGHLQIVNYAGTSLGSASTQTVSTATEYRICFTWNITNTTTHTMKVFVNGVQWCTETNVAALTAPGGSAFLYGPAVAPGANVTWHIANCIADDDSTNTDMGPRVVTAKLPASNNVNTFGTAIGANPANRWTNVNERPLSTTNGWQTSGTSQTENYGIQAAATGDVDCTKYQQVAYGGWAWASCTTAAPTCALTVNGSDTAITLTTTATFYTITPVVTATYPATQGVIGLNKTAGANNVQLYECGVIIVLNGNQPTAPGIDSAEDFGTPTVNQTVNAPGINSAEDFGVPSVTISANAPGINSAEDFGAPTINQTVNAPGIGSAEDFGTPTVTISVNAPGIDSAEDFGTPTVQQGGVSVNAPGIDSSEDFGAPAVAIGIVVAGIDSSEDFGVATVQSQFMPGPPAYASWPLEEDLFYVYGSWTSRMAR